MNTRDRHFLRVSPWWQFRMAQPDHLYTFTGNSRHGEPIIQ